MEELTKENVLEVWQNATLEEQRKNIDRVLELIDHSIVIEIWKSTKNEIKRENPNLIVRIIKEKLNNGNIYIGGIWKNTPQDVQEKTMEEVMQLYKNMPLVIKRIWLETDESVKNIKKDRIAQILEYNENLLKELEIFVEIPAFRIYEGKFSQQIVDEIIRDLQQEYFDDIMKKHYIEDETVRKLVQEYFEKIEKNTVNLDEEKEIKNIVMKYLMTRIPNHLVAYFFKQIINSDFAYYSEMFWENTDKDVKFETIEDILLLVKNQKAVELLWEELDSETQKRKIIEAMTKNTILSRMVQLTDGNIRRELAGKLIIEQESIDINEILDKIDVPITEDIAKYLSEMQDKEVIDEIVRTNLVEVSALEKLKGKISSQVSVKLVIKNASELSIEKLNELSEYFNITTIQMFDTDNNLDLHQMEPYDLETYKKCREVIDKLLEGVDLSQNLDDTNREKTIFAEVIKRLANHMSYDYESYEKIEKKQPVSNACANMVGGLLANTCVCSGYAEIVRNVFFCCGIEARYISGNNIEPEEHGHAWNQIKLDGTWYNMDLTWDRDSIVNGETTKYLLKSDYDFFDHDKYCTEMCKIQQCSTTILQEDMEWYLYGRLKFPKQVETTVRKTRMRRVRKAHDMIAASYKSEITNPEKEEEQWTN